MRSTQSGTAAKTASRHSLTALGDPGRLMISAEPRTPAVWRERIAVGTWGRETARIASPKPASSLSSTAAVASGVTSRGAGPVPPVVMTRQHPASSTSSTRVARISSGSSGMTRAAASQGEVRTSLRYALTVGPPRSSYTPWEARSETETMPMRATAAPGPSDEWFMAGI